MIFVRLRIVVCWTRLSGSARADCWLLTNVTRRVFPPPPFALFQQRWGEVIGRSSEHACQLILDIYLLFFFIIVFNPAIRKKKKKRNVNWLESDWTARHLEKVKELIYYENLFLRRCNGLVIVARVILSVYLFIAPLRNIWLLSEIYVQMHFTMLCPETAHHIMLLKWWK